MIQLKKSATKNLKRYISMRQEQTDVIQEFPLRNIKCEIAAFVKYFGTQIQML